MLWSAIFLCALLSGCSDLGVKPHQRGLLAKDSMLLVPDAVEAGLDDHIYFSKEATSGGRAVSVEAAADATDQFC